jgi:hypothetical protein
MKKGFLRKSPLVLIFMLCIILVLLGINGCLYQKNKGYRRENRQLIIQNDSLLSINIELNEALQNNRTATGELRER